MIVNGKRFIQKYLNALKNWWIKLFSVLETVVFLKIYDNLLTLAVIYTNAKFLLTISSNKILAWE
jgi:hypothetical protein